MREAGCKVGGLHGSFVGVSRLLLQAAARVACDQPPPHPPPPHEDEDPQDEDEEDEPQEE